MNLLSIALKSIRQRSLSSFLTGLSVALGVMLMVGVLVFAGIMDRTFGQDKVGYDLVVGPKSGSDIGLVLGAIYRVSPIRESLPFQYYLDLKEKDPRIETAIPISIGDQTEEGDFPIVGTTGEYFENEYAPGEPFRLTKNSRAINNPFDSIIGAEVAAVNGWKIGSEFKLVHAGDADHVHDEKFRVIGILKRTGTPNDKTVFVNIEGFFMLDEHDKPLDQVREQWVNFFGEERTAKELDPVLKKVRKHQEEDAKLHAEGGHDHHHHHHDMPDELKGVSAIFLKSTTDEDGIPLATKVLEDDINAGVGAQAVNPIIPMNRLKSQFIGPARIALLAMTVMIIFVSGVSIFVSIYNSMADRKREIAIMRALGASRNSVFAIILAESTVLCVLGGIAGLVLGHGLVFVAAPIAESMTGLLIDPFSFEVAELYVIPSLIALASLAGLVPGMTAYRTDVAGTLAE